MLENMPGDGFVHVAETVRRAIVNDEFVGEFLETELISYRLSVLRPL